MAFDVFISYAHDDKPAADAACAIMEKSGIRCWIAPRDIAPGAEYAAALIEALDACKAFVLIFSGHANEFPHIRREVERAVSRGVPLIPVRIENIEPSASLKYFVSSVHWLDALTPPLEQHFQNLATTLNIILKREGQKPNSSDALVPRAPVASAAPAPDRTMTRRVFRARLAAIGGLLCGGVMCLILVILHDTADLLADIGGAAVFYVFVYRNIPGDLATARLVCILLTGMLGYFVLINFLEARAMFFAIEGINMILALYLIYELSAMIEAKNPTPA